MPKVAAVRLTYNPKVLWFDPNGVEFRAGDALIVRTERGLEYGVADEDLKEVTEEDLENLKCALKPVERKATLEDELTWKEMQAKAADALPVFKKMVAEQGLDMHPVTVEFLFDGDKAVFYFEAEDRVDFRELVRVLAARFHVRIDMRQIGVRDEARIVGGYGHCGQELCCKRFGGEFNPVSIRMAKDQDLSLNPQKISGVCGRLMCCLRYEADTYKEFKGCCPKLNSMVSTPEGDAKVIEINVPRETVTIMSGDKRVKVPVADMTVDKKTGKPNAVPADVYDACVNADAPGVAAMESLVSPIFTGNDKLADKPVARRSRSIKAGAAVQQQAAAPSKKGSQRRGVPAPLAAQEEASEAKRPSRRRRRGGRGRGGEAAQAVVQAAPQQRQKQQPSKKAENKAASKQQAAKGGQQPRTRSARPGQRSSGLAASAAKKPMESRRSAAADAKTPAMEHRRSRRRSHKAQGGEARQS